MPVARVLASKLVDLKQNNYAVKLLRSHTCASYPGDKFFRHRVVPVVDERQIVDEEIDECPLNLLQHSLLK